MRRTRNKPATPYLPSHRSLILYLLALGGAAIGLAIAFAYGYSAYEGAARFENFGFFFGLMVLPLAIVLIEVATFLERSIPAKVVLGLTGALFMLLSAVITSIALSLAPDTDLSTLGGVGTGLLCFGPFVLLSLIPPTLALIHLPGALKDIRRTQRETKAVSVIHTQEGRVTYGDLATALNMPEEEVDELLRSMLAAGQITGVQRSQHRCFFTQKALNTLRGRLLGLINAQGALSLDALAHELQVPKGLIREWIYEWVESGKFTGYLDWDQEMIYSREAQKLRAGRACPNCGAQMSLAGKGVIRCPHCGTEVFLPDATKMP